MTNKLNNLDQLGINIVGAVDRSTRLFNSGEGFAAITGRIGMGACDCLYLGFIAERAYTVQVEGDLVISQETHLSIGDKMGGSCGFDVDWSETARRQGNGVGKIVVINPDLPDAPTVLQVSMCEPVGVAVSLMEGIGKNVAFKVHDGTDLTVLTRVARAAFAGQVVAISLRDAAQYGLCNILPASNLSPSPFDFGPERFRDPEAAAAALKAACR